MEISAPERANIISRRRFLALSGVAAVGLPLYAAEISRHELSVEHVTIPLPRLSDAFRGMRIVQISDFHYANFTEPFFIKLVVAEVTRIKADMVVFTGDFVTMGLWPPAQIAAWANDCAQHLSRVRCPVRYAILGNHDWDVGPDMVAEALASHKIPVLINQAVPLERDGKRLWLAGVADPLSGNADLDKTIPAASLTDGEPVILLSHEPDFIKYVAPYGVDLMLSGHTHGGQVRIPFLPPLFLPRLGAEFVEGLFRVGKTNLYVNRGIGAVGLPVRFNCPPEITVITLA